MRMSKLSILAVFLPLLAVGSARAAQFSFGCGITRTFNRSVTLAFRVVNAGDCSAHIEAFDQPDQTGTVLLDLDLAPGESATVNRPFPRTSSVRVTIGTQGVTGALLVATGLGATPLHDAGVATGPSQGPFVQSITGVGFEPAMVKITVLFNIGVASPPIVSSSIGIATSVKNQHAVGHWSGNPNIGRPHEFSDRIVAIVTVADSISLTRKSATLVSFDPDGFTLEWDGNASDVTFLWEAHQ